MYYQTDYDGMTPEQLHARIANLWAAVPDVPRNGRDVFQIVVAELERLRTIAEEQQDTLERIATEYPSAVDPCKCPPKHSCPKCEIAYLLNEWQQSHEPEQPLTTEEEYWTKRGFPATRLSRIARAAANL